MIKSKYVLFFVFLFFTVLTFVFSDIPFFWDNTFYSEAALRLYNGTDTITNCPQQFDNITLPLFSFYLSFVWKIFSKTLLVSHLAMLPFLLGLCYEYYILSKRFLNDKMTSLALILLIVQPTILTQAILMSYDIVFLYLFLLSVNKLLNKQYIFYSIIVTVLALFIVRGLLIGFALALIQLVLLFPEHKQKSFFIVFKTHLFCIIVTTIWFLYHQYNAGWLFFPPNHAETDETVLPLTMMLKQVGFIAWKLIDFGELFLWITFIIGLITLRKKKKTNNHLMIICFFLFIPLFVTTIFIIPFSNPIAHRYFLFTFALMAIGTAYIIQEIQQSKIMVFVSILLIISLTTGNFWLYPERFGNGWDSSLKVIPYFKLKKEMDEFIKNKKIESKQIGTQFPLIADKLSSDLSDSSYCYINVWRGPITNYQYFLQTNVINTDIPEQIKEVKDEWILLKELKSGLVYISLYENKN